MRSLREVEPRAWNALVGEDDPFVEHAFLLALEESRSVGPGTGWEARHVLCEEGGELVAAMPAYRKDDSWGEFTFDFQWARAAAQAGVRYYPKLVSMVPFTPATGRRLLVSDRVAYPTAVAALGDGLRDAADDVGASSIHVLYVTAEERDALVGLGWLRPRVSVQFHWTSAGDADFEAFLARFRSPARKQVRRERREVKESGIEVRVLEGPELSPAEWHALHTFYRLNCARHGTYGYLTPRFFELMRERFAERVVAVLAYKEGEPIAGALNFEKGRHLYGRYWGATEAEDFLHFECCYHRLVERSIDKRHTLFEAGAQGAHKLKRGLLPAEVHSVHWARDPRLDAAIGDYLPREAAAVREEIAELARMGPFRRDGE